MINTLRSNEVFDASLYTKKKIVVVGLGAIGSRVVEHLVCAGLENITAVDYDGVEDHNLGNQIYDRRDIGLSKVVALERWAGNKCGWDITEKMKWINEMVKPDHKDRTYWEDVDIVVSCVDTFAARLMLMEIAEYTMAEIFVEAGMATGHGNMFMVNPMSKPGVAEWEKTIGSDDDPSYETSACGTGLSVGVTASLMAGMMSWSIMNYLKTGYVEKKLRLDTAPFMINKTHQR